MTWRMRTNRNSNASDILETLQAQAPVCIHVPAERLLNDASKDQPLSELQSDLEKRILLVAETLSSVLANGSVNGFGAFDLNVINSDGTGSKVSTISFSVTSSDFIGLTASQVLDVNANGFDAAAHVVDFNGTSNPPTFFVAEAPGQSHVPDSGATATLLGLGLTGLSVLRARFGRN